MNTRNDILVEARRLADESKSWADLSNALFDPLEGLVARQFADASKRAAFRKTDTYAKLHKLVEKKMQQNGVVSGAEPTKSGRFVVRLPKSMHAALEREAITEGTSLNQLVLAKLAIGLSELVKGDKSKETSYP